MESNMFNICFSVLLKMLKMPERWDDGIPRCSRDCHKDGVQVRCVTPKRWMAQPRLAKNNMRGATATAAPTAQVAKISPNGSAIIESVKILKSICRASITFYHWCYLLLTPAALNIASRASEII